MMSDAHTLRPILTHNVSSSNGPLCREIEDDYGSVLSLYPEAEEILHELSIHEMWKDTLICYVSRTTEIESAHFCLSHLHVGVRCTMDEIGHHKEIYPGNKTHHFRSIRDEFGIEYCDMLFFDNERRNTKDVSSLGVVSCYTPGGLTRRGFDIGLEAFQEGGTLHVSDR